MRSKGGRDKRELRDTACNEPQTKRSKAINIKEICQL
jgi:hypothetical protein